MEENIDGLLKEKDNSAHLVMIPVTTIPIEIAGIEPSSSSTAMESISTTQDSIIVVRDLAIHKRDNEKLLEKLKTLET